jgi:hypothetical protein
LCGKASSYAGGFRRDDIVLVRTAVNLNGANVETHPRLDGHKCSRALLRSDSGEGGSDSGEGAPALFNFLTAAMRTGNILLIIVIRIVKNFEKVCLHALQKNS